MFIAASAEAADAKLSALENVLTLNRSWLGLVWSSASLPLRLSDAKRRITSPTQIARFSAPRSFTSKSGCGACVSSPGEGFNGGGVALGADAPASSATSDIGSVPPEVPAEIFWAAAAAAGADCGADSATAAASVDDEQPITFGIYQNITNREAGLSYGMSKGERQ